MIQAGSVENLIHYTAPGRPLRPHIAADIVTRPRLLRLLERGASLVLVVAPAGYGKTTLIAEWLETCNSPAAWVALDADISDLHRFLVRLLTTVNANLPGFGGNILRDFPTMYALPPSPVVAEMLHAAFAALDSELVLVLDDYQVITAQEVHELLSELLRLQPTPLRLVLVSRHDPPLPLVSLRAQGQLVEIRSRDLGFTATEAAQFLTNSLSAPLDETEVAALVKSTEGWAASLRLAQLYLRQEQGFASLTQAIEVGAQRTREFLAEEVFAALPPAIQEFLMQTAILDQVSARLCAALSDDGDVAAAQANLRWLVANGVFTVPVDDALEWFRYHALLRQLASQQLHARYDDAKVALLHCRASDWSAAAGNVAIAIRHALAAGDTGRAVRILAGVRPALMDKARWLDIAHLLHLFSALQIESEPELLVTQAWIARSQNTIAPLQASGCIPDSREGGRIGSKRKETGNGDNEE